MNRLATSILAMLVLLGGIAAAQEPASAEQLEDAETASDSPFASDLERSSYAVGYNIGSSLLRSHLEFELEGLLEGLTTAAKGEEGLLSVNEVAVLTQKAQNNARERYMAARQALVEANHAAGEAFMAEVVEREGVVAMPSGWAYEVIEEGDGPQPGIDDWVQVHYLGTLVDGTTFDSSRLRGAPALLRPNTMIQAWIEALPMMSVGSTWKLYVPSDLGYGDNEGASNIPPGATLTYEIELLSVLSEEEAQKIIQGVG